MYLVQRGEFKCPAPQSFAGLVGNDGLVTLYYMGSAEFEWGAIPNSYARIMGTYPDRHLFNSGLKNPNGLTLWVFCRVADWPAVKQEIQEYLKGSSRPLKESISLKEVMKEGRRESQYRRKDNFWWNISMDEVRTDWMAFVGGVDRKDLFLRGIHNDYHSWWMAKSEEEREDRYQKAIHNHW